MQRSARHLVWVFAAAVVAGALLSGCAQQSVGMREGFLDGPRQGESESASRNQARVDAAMELITRLEYAEAAALLEEAVYGDDSKAVSAQAAMPASSPQSMFWLAFCREKMGELRKAADLYDAVSAVAPGTKYARQARTRRGRLVEREAPGPESPDGDDG
jgi:Tfp pilus assembly protein PilF